MNLSSASPEVPPPIDTHDLRRALKTYWGYDGFRALQLESIEAVLKRQDSLTLLPTGGGKSLCYQLPILFFPQQTALIISPLISLMEDQVQQAKAKGFRVGCLNSSQSPDARRALFAAYQAGDLQLLYVSPERLVNEGFLQALKTQGRLAYIAVDEAHCISQWGHQFRPDYQKLGVLKEMFPDVAIHAFTATAPKTVITDIIGSLTLEAPQRFQSSMFRANLEYRTEARHRRETDFIQLQLLPFLKSKKGQAGIIYCYSRSQVEKLVIALQVQGIHAKAYHAGLSDALRQQHQSAFMAGEVPVMVATVAFGMGIDRGDLRFVIHAHAPQSLEHYVQEAGRAGRDGYPAECLLFYSAQDFTRWELMLKRNQEGELFQRSLQRLWDMQAYTEAMTCRHVQILDYFGQSFNSSKCSGCDVCQTRPDVYANASLLTQHVLSSIWRLKEEAFFDVVVGVLLGEASFIPVSLRPQAQLMASYATFNSLKLHHFILFMEQLERLNLIHIQQSQGVREHCRITLQGMQWLKASKEGESPLLLCQGVDRVYLNTQSLVAVPESLRLRNAMPKPPRKARKRSFLKP
ncbi:MAG: ATP-dependent DNA helicase RecQ [Vampirovibrio sp.]